MVMMVKCHLSGLQIVVKIGCQACKFVLNFFGGDNF